MQVPVIRTLVSNYTIAQLKEAEEAIMNEHPCPISDAGKDEGEQLTHILASIWIRELMDTEAGLDLTAAIRRYSQRVRESIN